MLNAAHHDVVAVGADVFGVEPHGRGDGAREPVEHHVVEELVQSELLRQVAVRMVPVGLVGPEKKRR